MRQKTDKPPAKPAMTESLLVDARTGEPVPHIGGKDPLAVLLGRRGGLKGGKARSEALTPEQRSEIARAAARKRWIK